MKKLIAFVLIISLCISISVVSYADPLTATIGIGSAFAEASGVTWTIGGMSMDSSSSWYNTNSGADPVQIQNAVDADLTHDVQIKAKRNNDNSVTVQIPNDSSLAELFNGSNGYSASLFDNYSITDNSRGQILNEREYYGTVCPNVDGTSGYSSNVLATVQAGVSITIGEIAVDIYEENDEIRYTSYWQGTQIIDYKFTQYQIGKPIRLWMNPSCTQVICGLSLNDQAYGIYYSLCTHATEYGLHYSNISYASNVIDVSPGEDYIHITIEEDYIDQSASYMPVGIGATTTLTDLSSVIAWIADLGSQVEGTGVSIEAENTDDDIGPPIPPPPTPVPTDALGDIPYDTWLTDTTDVINDGLQDVVDVIGDGITEITDAVDDATDAIDTWGQSIWSKLEAIRLLLVEKLGSLEDILEDILEAVLELVESIVESAEDLLAATLNQLDGAFGSWWDDILDSLNIWHYVVEWIGSIRNVFTFFWNICANTSYYIVLPVYASLAGAVCLAFYKRFGK